MSVADGASDPDRLELAAAFHELQNLLLEGSDLTDFLRQVAVLSADVVPATAAGITIRRDREVTTVACSGDLALIVDEIQYGHGEGPCLQTLHDGAPVVVSDLGADGRWPAYQPRAYQAGIRSSLSLPLTVEQQTIGALNLYGTSVDQFAAPAASRARAFARQATTTLRIVMRQAEQLTLESQLREALITRAVIDQALGILMALRRCTASEAFALLREGSQTRNMKLSDVAAELIETTSGHPPQPPRPFTDRR